MLDFLTKILEKYKLQEKLEWQVGGKKELIIDKLSSLTSQEYYSAIFVVMDWTIPMDKKYIGTISNEKFILRKRIGIFPLLPGVAIVRADFKTMAGQIKISGIINGMRPISLAIRLLVLGLISLLTILVIFEALIPPIGQVNPFPDLFFIFLIAGIFLLIPYLMARRSIRMIKSELSDLLGVKDNLQ